MKQYKTLISATESSITDYNDGNDPYWFVIDLDQSLIDMIKYQARHLSYTNAFSIETHTPYGDFLTDEAVEDMINAEHIEDTDDLTERLADEHGETVRTEGVYIKVFKEHFMFTAHRQHADSEIDFFKTARFDVSCLDNFDTEILN